MLARELKTFTMRSTDARPPEAAHGAMSAWFTRLDWLLLFLIFVVAVFFRLWQQGQVSPGKNFDEAFESLEARRLLTNPAYRPITSRAIGVSPRWKSI
jgi:hypothetical protein